MTPDEVRGIYGDPKNETVRPDGVSWYYDCGRFTFAAPISVSFGKDGRVEYVYILD